MDTFPGANHPQLTGRMKQIIKGVVDGLTNQQIADRLGVSRPIVSNDLARVYMILDISNRTQLARLVLDEGWVPPTTDRSDGAHTEAGG